MKPNFDIDLFCNVIDNFGDAGVAWRIAKALAIEKKFKIRLYIDKPRVLASFAKEVEINSLPQLINGQIEVRQWNDCLYEPVSPIVIETFGCRLPEDYEKRLCLTKPTPIWINIEYLSAEDWVESCHLLPSPHPKFGTPKYFFFPGFTAKTGGLTIEQKLIEKQISFAENKAQFFNSFGCNPDLFSIFVFSYPTAPISMFAELLEQSRESIQLILSHGEASENLYRLLKKNHNNNINAVRIPMVSQETFDALLFCSDLLIVRGEDSFVRAQLAAKPFVWNIYPQEEQTHLKKLNAFFDRMIPILGASGQILKEVNFDFNTNSEKLSSSWANLISNYPDIKKAMIHWREYLFRNGSLIDKLCNFIDKKLE